MESTTPAYVAVSVSMPPENLRRLDHLARKAGCSRSEFLRRLVDTEWSRDPLNALWLSDAPTSKVRRRRPSPSPVEG